MHMNELVESAAYSSKLMEVPNSDLKDLFTFIPKQLPYHLLIKNTVYNKKLF